MHCENVCPAGMLHCVGFHCDNLNKHADRHRHIMNKPELSSPLDALVNEANPLIRGKPNDQTPDNVRAFELFSQAAAEGHLEAQYQLFRCYQWGRGVRGDSSEAEKWLRKAAQAGSVNAQILLGVAHLSGTMCPGITKDEEAAIACLREAAKSRELAPALLLWQIYEERQDTAQAMVWMKHTAQRGDLDSLYRVLKAYRNNEMLRSNKTEWYQWLRLGLESGCATEEQLRSLEETMQPQELAEARHSYLTSSAGNPIGAQL